MENFSGSRRPRQRWPARRGWRWAADHAPHPTPSTTSASAPQVEPRARSCGGEVGWACAPAAAGGRWARRARHAQRGTVGERWSSACATRSRHEPAPVDAGAPASVGNSSRISMARGWAKAGGRAHVVRGVGHLRAGLDSLVAVAGQRPQDDVRRARAGTAGCAPREERRRTGARARRSCRSFSPLEQAAPGEHLVQAQCRS